ncbi:MAG: twin-arginine translocase subunit TatC [Gammaproteobacteria bacterium]|nr:twin-arginine translocase subunit TatC [Gammaproteobacteria bacterium]
MKTVENEGNLDNGQPLVEHLIELRTRLLKIVSIMFLIFVPLLFFANDIYDLISEPLRNLLPPGATMIATEVASPFLTPFKLAFVTSFFIAIPFILHQIWSFIAPGLYSYEKKFMGPIFLTSILLFYLGMAFAYFAVFPLVFDFFASVMPKGVSMMTDINRYLDFVLKLFFAFGLAFEIPIATIILVWSGTITIESIKNKRPYVIVGCFVFGMLLTPPDVISQVLLAIPMWFLFEIGIFLCKALRLGAD